MLLLLEYFVDILTIRYPLSRGPTFVYLNVAVNNKSVVCKVSPLTTVHVSGLISYSVILGAQELELFKYLCVLHFTHTAQLFLVLSFF